MTLQFRPPVSSECRQLEAQLTPFVDGEAAPAVQAAIEAHLAGCAACRDSVAAQREVRALLVARRPRLSEPAPAHMAAAVRRAIEPASRPVWTRVPAFAAAAAVVLVVLAGLAVATSGSSVLLAAQLTLDHLKCFVIDGDDHDHPMSAAGGQVRLQQEYGMDVRLPDVPASADARLVSVRQCLYGDGWVAHALYRVEGEAVSVFVLPGGAVEPADVQAFGRHAEVVNHGGSAYVVVSPAGQRGVAATLGLLSE